MADSEHCLRPSLLTTTDRRMHGVAEVGSASAVGGIGNLSKGGPEENDWTGVPHSGLAFLEGR